MLTLKAAINALHSVCPKWYNIGVQLEVPTFQLKIIEKKSSDLMDQLRDTLDYWMNNDPSASWRHLVDALKAPSVGEKWLAEKIEEEYCNPEEHSSPDRSKASAQVKCHQGTYMYAYSWTTLMYLCDSICDLFTTEVPNQDYKTTPEGTYLSAGAPTLKISSIMAKIHSGGTSHPPSEDFEPEHKKPWLDDDTQPNGGSTSHPPSEGFEPEQKKPLLDNDIKPENLSSSEGSQKTPFGCGCGKCTAFSFIERGCPTPIPSASSFPYLDLSELTHEQQQELKGKLRSESQEIMIRFQELVSATIKSFKRRCIPLDELVSHVMTLGAFDPVFKEPQIPVFHHCFQELKAVDTIVLNDYFSFFNYHIIEHIIKELGTEEDKAELQRYKKDFNQYAKRRIFECPTDVGPKSDADHADIFVKVDSQYDNYTVEQVEGFRRKLSKILHLSSKGILRLCRVDKGCFRLMFQIPSFVQQEVFPLSREQEMALEDEGVIKLTCREYQFLVKLPASPLDNGIIAISYVFMLSYRRISHHRLKLV